jgi:hypothetical protein
MERPSGRVNNSGWNPAYQSNGVKLETGFLRSDASFPNVTSLFVAEIRMWLWSPSIDVAVVVSAFGL